MNKRISVKKVSLTMGYHLERAYEEALISRFRSIPFCLNRRDAKRCATIVMPFIKARIRKALA
jgi:hypothetical protein